MEKTAQRAQESLVRPQKPAQARCADAIGADLMRSGRVLRRSNTPLESPMAPVTTPQAVAAAGDRAIPSSDDGRERASGRPIK
jgi:hypothetical protein